MPAWRCISVQYPAGLSLVSSHALERARKVECRKVVGSTVTVVLLFLVLGQVSSSNNSRQWLIIN